MAAESEMLCRADPLVVRGVRAWSEEHESEPAPQVVGPARLASLPSSFLDNPSLVFSLRAEVEALRKEAQQLREEVEFWKGQSQKHYRDAQYWRALHQKALDRIAERE